MADWTDGADYAPVAPPMGFAAPQVKPLDAGVATAVLPGDGAPVPPSAFDMPAQPGPPLEALHPAVENVRDPHQPFAASQSMLGLATDHDPRQPFDLGSSDPLNSPSLDFAPPTGAPVATMPPPGTQPLPAPGMSPQSDPYGFGQAAGPTQPGWVAQPASATLGEVLKQTGYPLLGTLLVGLLLAPLSLPALIVAWMLSMNVKTGGLQVRRSFGLALGAVAACTVYAIIAQYYAPFDIASTASRWICGILLIVCPLLVWRASQRPAA